MEFLSNTVVLSRLQFALTAIFHMLWPVLTTGLAIYLVIVEGLWLKTRNIDYYHHARFWSKIYVLNFAVGVASGLPMEFQFGTNWAPFAEAVGDFFGSILGFEASMAFMLEAGFLGIMIFGWHRVHPVMHYLSTIMVAFGANLSTFWILTANSWLQTPTGGEMVDGKFVIDHYFQALFNPFMLHSVLHMFFATLETSLFVIGGISAWYLLKNRHASFFAKSFKIALAASILVAPLQISLGHWSGNQVHEYQPTKFAAMEAEWETIPAGEPAAWKILAWPNDKAQTNDWEIEVPYALSYILEMKKELSKPVKGLNEWRPEDRPHLLVLIFYSFRIMIAIGFLLAGIMLFSAIQWLRGKLSVGNITQQRLLLLAWIFSGPLGYIAVETGWIVRCVGRQPWTVYGQIRTVDAAASNLPATNVLTSLSGFLLIYSFLFGIALYFGTKIIHEGPELELPAPPVVEGLLTWKSEPAQRIPDRRPIESSSISS